VPSTVADAPSGRLAGLRAAADGTFRSLRLRNFRLFFGGQLVSQAGTWMQTVSVAWVVLQLTDSGVALGLITAAQFLPVLLLGAWGGVVADRVDRRRLMLATQVAFTVIAATFAVATVLDRLAIGLLFGLSAMLGVLTAIDNPSRRTLVALAPKLPLALLAVIPVGATTIFLVSGANALIQVQADDRMRGRALALTTVVFLGSTPIGGPIAGWVSEHFGARMGLMLGAAGTALVALWVGGRAD